MEFINLNQTNTLSIGQSLGYSKYLLGASQYQPLWNFMGLNLLGDPELHLKHQELLPFPPLTLETLSDAIQMTGLPADSTETIIAYCNNITQGRTSTFSSSCIIPNLPLNSTVMVYKNGFKPYLFPTRIQNCSLVNSQYLFASDFYAGRDVNDNQEHGDVVIPAETKYEIEFTKSVTFAPGFIVEKGAELHVKPSNY